MENELILVEVSPEYKEKAIEYKRKFFDFGENHINGSCAMAKFDDWDEWFEEIRLAKEGNRKNNRSKVAATSYFSVRKSDGVIVGTIQLRHTLDEELLESGGHIGYGICPPERKKGYGYAQLMLVLEKAKELGIDKVLITCDKDNPASAATAQKAGGILEKEVFVERENGVIQFYWIDLA